ncbi:MAG: class I SAM-dependent methyltransferase [bacterium]|nr:class I SAM-dependent methyltransferase [bacterium]
MFIEPSDLTRRTVETLVHPRRGFLSGIDPRDEMYLYNLDLLHRHSDCAAVLYFLKGRQIADAVREIGRWYFRDVSAVASFLDFGSGYGRATRFFVGDLPPESVWVSDILQDAVDFQAGYFGVHAFASTEDPHDLYVGKKFDYVFAASLFSHLPEKTFGAWMGCLFELVEEGGLLVVSVLDRSLFDAGREAAASGMIFLPESESRVLDGAQYGTTYVSEELMRATIHRQLHGPLSVRRVSAGLCAHQDLYIMAKRGRVDFSTMPLKCLPQGEMDWFEYDGGGIVEVGGWARATARGDAIAEIRVYRGDRILKTVRTQRTGDRGKERWRLSIDLGEVGPDEMILAMAGTDFGVENVIAIGTLRPFITRQGESDA